MNITIRVARNLLGIKTPKYRKGEFGYYWTEVLGNEDIENTDFKGDLRVTNAGLVSLRGCPKFVRGNFYCGYNPLKTLLYCPIHVYGNCEFNSTDINSLRYGPTYVAGSLNVGNASELSNIEDMPTYVGGNFCFSYTKVQRVDVPLSDVVKGYYSGTVNGKFIYSKDFFKVDKDVEILVNGQKLKLKPGVKITINGCTVQIGGSS